MSSKWQSPKSFSQLSANEVHVWRAYSHDFMGQLAQLQECLSEEELARANRFIYQEYKNRFIISQGLLRFLLANYLKQDAASIKFVHNDFGKPFLADTDALKFNLSHSGDWVLFAFAFHDEVGIDIELIRYDLEHNDIANRFFSKDEWEQLQLMPAATRQLAFFHCWTRKEAFIKAIGRGLAFSLQEFSVDVDPNKADSKVLLHESDLLEQECVLSALNVGADYVAALAMLGQRKKITTLACNSFIFQN